MQRIDLSIYRVTSGETVTVEIEATKVGNFATLTVDGNLLDPLPGVTPLTFQFPVTVAPGFDHFGIVSVQFPPDAPDDAFFQISVLGSRGGGRFTDADIRKTDLG